MNNIRKKISRIKNSDDNQKAKVLQHYEQPNKVMGELDIKT